ncbi:MAG: DUF4112 domain-containing protein [Bryobacteraceae bacterium]
MPPPAGPPPQDPSGFDRPRLSYGPEPHPADEIIERLAWVMDSSIPIGGGYSIGLDPILGLFPGLGDLAGTLVGATIVVQAHRAGVPRATLLRMVANVGIDAVVGAVPLVGDLFDFAFKANTKNLQLYRASRAGLHRTSRDQAFLALLILVLAAILAIPTLLIVWLVRTIV